MHFAFPSCGFDDRYLHAISSRALCGIHSRVRLCDEVLTPHAQGIAGGHTNAACELDGAAKALHAYLGYSIADSLCDRMSGRDVSATEDDHELFASPAPDHVGLPQLRLDRHDDGAETGVTRRMPVRIVDLLEVVQIDKQQGDRQAARSSAHASCIQPLYERAPVQHAGQWIGLGSTFGLRERKTLLTQSVGD